MRSFLKEATQRTNCVGRPAPVDLKGALQTVSAAVLVDLLEHDGNPTQLVRWVASFMNHRTATLRLDDTVSEPFSISIGIPHRASRLSPILFLFFSAWVDGTVTCVPAGTIEEAFRRCN